MRINLFIFQVKKIKTGSKKIKGVAHAEGIKKYLLPYC
jgi:hypothetical protein